MPEEVCKECGTGGGRLVKGLCTRCYARALYHQRKAAGRAVMKGEKPLVMAPETMIDCGPYQCRMMARWCIYYQTQAREAADTYEPMSEKAVWRDKCLRCTQGKEIAAAVKRSAMAAVAAQATKPSRKKSAAAGMVSRG